jgi:alpha-maltose-1-phosphate synthase
VKRRAGGERSPSAVSARIMTVRHISSIGAVLDSCMKPLGSPADLSTPSPSGAGNSEAAQPALKVLVIAESADPEASSSSLVGWSLSRALRDHVDVHVITHVRNRNSLTRAGWSEGREFTALDPGRVERPVLATGGAIRRALNLGWTWTTAVATVSYYYFELLAWQRFGTRIRRGEFDVVHRITPVSPVTPSLTIALQCRRAGVPFVWGPMNGGVAWPREFRDAMRREGEWLSYFRAAHRLLPGYGVSRKGAAALIAGSITAWDQLREHHARCVYLPENAIDPDRFAVASGGAPANGPLRVAFVGRFVPLKCVDVLIEAAAPLVRSGKVELDLIGDGPEMASLRRKTAEERIQDGVEFPGWIDHRKLAARLARSQVFAFPSIREFGGGVVLEAMALGLAPVVVDYGGPTELVTEETGFRVPLGPRASLVAAYREILGELARSPERARQAGAAARLRAYRLFTWDVKARQIVEIYRWALAQRPKPDFGMPLTEDAAAAGCGQRLVTR